MTLYAIGDIQGCYDEYRRLLDKAGFDPARDRLWLTGDLVNRGPKSVEVLRHVMSLGDAATTVLGNHDLHLLAVAAGLRKYRRSDSFADVMAAPDRDALYDWLRRRPLLVRHPTRPLALVHAGLPPQWTLDSAAAAAAEVEAFLQGPDCRQFLAVMYGNEPGRWKEDLTGLDRLRFTVNGLTRLRYCTEDGRIDFDEKRAPGKQPAHLKPWFAWPKRRSRGTTIVCGHWSTLGLHVGDGVIALDTGCIWGGGLTLVNLDAVAEPVRVSCKTYRDPANN